jgi:hypothetical protein
MDNISHTGRKILWRFLNKITWAANCDMPTSTARMFRSAKPGTGWTDVFTILAIPAAHDVLHAMESRRAPRDTWQGQQKY